MPIIIEGYVVVRTDKLREHEHHPLYARNEDRVSLWCDRCLVMLEQEPEPRHDLPCGCESQADHDEGVVIQRKYQRRAGKNACVGCEDDDENRIEAESRAMHDLDDEINAAGEDALNREGDPAWNGAFDRW